MKKIFATIALLAVVSVTPAMARPYGKAGCGLGNLAFDKNSQVLAATTNGTSASQMFGITSGTSNCTDDGTVKTSMQVPLFIEANQLALATDVARGSGETIANLSQVMGCSDPGYFATALQRNYSHIFTTQNVPATAVTDSIRNVVKQDAKLAGSCKDLG